MEFAPDNPPISPITPIDTPDAQTYAIIGAAQEVHRVFGCGFLEKVYQRSLAAEFRRRGIPFQLEVTYPLDYKGEDIDCHYRADLVCFGHIIVETKALSATGGAEASQVLNYLKASGLKVGLLLNFGTPSLQVRRFSVSW